MRQKNNHKFKYLVLSSELKTLMERLDDSDDSVARSYLATPAGPSPGVSLWRKSAMGWARRLIRIET